MSESDLTYKRKITKRIKAKRKLKKLKSRSPKHEQSENAARTWDFTLFSKDDMDKPFTEDDHFVKRLKAWEPDVTRLRVSGEICPDTDRPHLQCKVTFNKTKRFGAVKKLIPTAHIEKSKETRDWTYCAKIDDSILFIDINNGLQGKRSDLDEIHERIKKGGTKKELWEDHFPTMVRYHKGIDTYLAVRDSEPVLAEYPLESFEWKPLSLHKTANVIWGAPGIGKTQFALAHFTTPLLVSEINDLKGYDPQVHDGIVFDDMDFTDWDVGKQIHLTDWDLKRPIRILYGTVNIPRHTRKIFTTNKRYGAIFDLDPSFGVSRRVTVTEVRGGNTKLPAEDVTDDEKKPYGLHDWEDSGYDST